MQRRVIQEESKLIDGDFCNSIFISVKKIIKFLTSIKKEKKVHKSFWQRRSGRFVS